MRKAAIGILLVMLMMTLAVCAQAAVEIYEAKASTLVPAFIDYKLNCAADVTIQILPSTSGGTPTGPAIRTVTLTGQSRGSHRYIWLADKDDGTTAPRGAYYMATITATSNRTQWDPIIGLYLNSDYNHEYTGRPDLPSVPDTEGFYGIGINTNKTSPYYGRIYVTHKVLKSVYMYGPDGMYLGRCNDTGITWGSSAPWDLTVADDGYVYVADRSNQAIYCFDPAGNKVSQGVGTYFRGIFARTMPDGVTHIFMTGAGNGTLKCTVSANHLTWTAPVVAYQPSSGDGWDSFGVWVSPDLKTAYNCSLNPGTPYQPARYPGLSRWQDPELDGTYVKDSWSSDSDTVTDMAFYDAPGTGTDFMWVTRMADWGNDDTTTTANEYSRALYKVDPATGTRSGDFDLVRWGHMCAVDAVGNIALTFGKPTASWAQRYWAVMSEAGTTTATKNTGAFFLGSTPAPVVVPGSAVWTPDATIAANDADTASVTFKVMDVDGWADVTSVTLDLIPLGYSGTTVCTRARDMSDPNAKTAICTLAGIKAKVGTRCTTSYGQPVHNLKAIATDTTGGSNYDDTAININVTGDPVLFNASIKHRRVTGWFIDGAQVQAVGGGIAGATDLRAKGPFTYTSAPSSTSGAASLELSAGTFSVTAKKVGFGSETPTSVTVPYAGGTQILYLRPLTIAEARATGNATKINVEGVCYSQPQGLAPTAVNGLAPRTDTLVKRGQFYVCDPNSPANGLLFMVTEHSDAFVPTWHDPDAIDDFGNPLYIGKRPAQGETIMVTGILDTPGGHERRVLVQDADILAGMTAYNVNRTYFNRGNLGGLPATPTTLSIGDFAHGMSQGFMESWGKFAQTTGAMVVGYKADGTEPGIETSTIDPVPYATVANASGQSAHVAIDMPATLGVSTVPTIGATYTFKGATGRRVRYGQGAIRVRSNADIVFESAAPAPPGPISVCRTEVDGTAVNTSGIVTAKIGTSMWIEAADRTIGIRVKVNPTYVALGDAVQVIGTIGTENGERFITPTKAILPISTGNTVGAFDMRSREIGGVGNGTTPGVDTGRGALNVGLKVHFLGMVTAIDTSATPAWYYLWDGANRSDLPVSDASGNLGVKIDAAPPAGVVAWKDWVDVTGVVSTNSISGSIVPTIQPTSAAKVTTFATISSPAGTALTAQWNLMSLPAAPAEISDGEEYNPKPWEPYSVLAPTKDPMEIDGRLYRWENCSGGLNIYDMWSEVGSHGPFGGMLLGDGYWLNIDDAWGVSYKGKNSTLDQWIGICEPGWMIIGHPKDHNTFLADVKVHDGAAVYSMYDAVMTNAWIDCVGYWWDNVGQGLVDIGIPDCWATSDTLMPWHGYWLQAYQGGLALIVPEAPAAP